MKREILSLALTAVFLTGCSESAAEENISYAEGEATESSVITAEGPTRDLDYIRAQSPEDDINTFFSAYTLTEKEFYPTDKSVHFSGRHLLYNDVEYLSNTCSSVDFVMTGDRIEAVLVCNGSVYKETQQAYMAVVINGEIVKRFKVDSGENSYVLYEGDKLINADVSLVKLSESAMANLGIKSLKVNATSLAPKRSSDLQIEFIGDSITCGYGNEGAMGSGKFDSAEENGMATYAYLTAKALGADCSLVCASGIGIISDSTVQGVLEDYLLMPEMYDYADMNFEMRRGYDEYTPWDFGEGSDIVVINLGTNDYSYTGRNEELQAEFGSAYYEFIGQVRRNNPEAIIICTLGIMGSELYNQIEYAAEQYATDNADNKIYTYKFEYQSEDDGYGTDFHPSVATHEKAAQRLSEYIKGILF